MKNSNNTEPMIPPMKSDPTLKDYICPHCNKFLFRGNVKNLNMVCQHCQKMIRACEDELFQTDTE